jgi:hypothetical protein
MSCDPLSPVPNSWYPDALLLHPLHELERFQVPVLGVFEVPGSIVNGATKPGPNRQQPCTIMTQTGQ